VFRVWSDLPERLELMSSNGLGVSILPELFRVGLYKSRQGKLVRQATFVCLAILAGFGVVSLSGQLEGSGKYVQLGAPLAVWVLICWVSFRAVNVPKFADFLISVEAELERVVWPTREQVIQATIVVLVVMFSLGMFLTVSDIVWKELFRLVGFIEY
jgi:preprotein translocase subunit SecE